jgi:hypothetical protein
MYKKILISLGMFCCAPIHANFTPSNKEERCLDFGDKPAFIIQFKDKKANIWNKSKLSMPNLTAISKDNVTFTGSKPVANGAYLVYYDEKSAAVLEEIRPHCYSPKSVEQFMNELKKQPNIKSIIPNQFFPLENDAFLSREKAMNFSSVALIAQQWDMMSPPGGANLEGAWAITSGSANVMTAVMDNGTLLNAALRPNLVYFNSTSPGVYFKDGGQWGLGSEPSCPVNICSDANHGTHVAGTVASSGELAYGQNVYGMAYSSKVLPINVFTQVNTNELSSQTVDLINAWAWLSGQHFPGLPNAPSEVKTINMSLGGVGACNIQSQELISTLVNQGKTVVAGAGNSNMNVSEFFPARCDGVIAVAATGPSGERAWYTNWGPRVDIAAPGGNSDNSATYNLIYSTVQEGYEGQEGTSMASPHVAGLAALMYSVFPDILPEQILIIMQKTSTPFPTKNQLSQPDLMSCVNPEKPLETCGAGIINATLALQAAIATRDNTLVLTQATRNPMNPTQGFIYYQGGYSATTGYQVIGPEEDTASVVMDTRHSRFIVSGIQSPKGFRIGIYTPEGAVTNFVKIPSLLG